MDVSVIGGGGGADCDGNVNAVRSPGDSPYCDVVVDAPLSPYFMCPNEIPKIINDAFD